MEITREEYDFILAKLKSNQEMNIVDLSWLTGVDSLTISMVQHNELKKLRGDMSPLWTDYHNYGGTRKIELTIKTN